MLDSVSLSSEVLTRWDEMRCEGLSRVLLSLFSKPSVHCAVVSPKIYSLSFFLTFLSHIWFTAPAKKSLQVLWRREPPVPGLSFRTLAVGRRRTHPKSTKHSVLLLLFQDHAEINSTVLRSQTNTARVEGLRSGTVYVVQVRARTVAGFGKYSSKMCFQTLTDGKDGRARRAAVAQPPLSFHLLLPLLPTLATFYILLLHDNVPKAEVFYLMVGSWSKMWR